MNSNTHWTGRIRHAALITGATLGLLLIFLAVTGQRLSSQGGNVSEIGLDGYQFVGRIDQNGASFTGYGYLYDMTGVSPDKLFSDPYNPSEETAHFTYYATATLSSCAVLTDAVRSIFALDSTGEITFYYQATPAASFADPGSFAEGEAVTNASLHLQDILTVQAPNRGLSNGNGVFDVLTAQSFEFDGGDVRLGRPGRSYRITTVGDAVRTDAAIPQSSVLLAGSAFGAGGNQAFLPLISSDGEQ